MHSSVTKILSPLHKPYGIAPPVIRDGMCRVQLRIHSQPTTKRRKGLTTGLEVSWPGDMAVVKPPRQQRLLEYNTRAQDTRPRCALEHSRVVGLSNGMLPSGWPP